MHERDLRITQSIQKLGVSTMDFWWFIARFGLYAYAAVVIGVTYFITEKHRVLLVLIPVAVTVGVTVVLQRIVRRARPKATKTTFDLWLSTYSFPSAHSSTSFAFAGSLSLLFLNSSLQFSWIYVVVFFALAICIALSRIIVGVHYFYDVLMGSLLGIFFSITLTSV